MSVKGKEKFEEEKKEARGGFTWKLQIMLWLFLTFFTSHPLHLLYRLQYPPDRTGRHIFKRLSKMTLGANDSMPTVTGGLVLSVCACCEAGCKPGNRQADPNKVKGR